MCFYTLKKIINKENIDPPKNTKKKSITEISDVLIDAFPSTSPDSMVSRVYLDQEYHVAPFEEYIRFIDADNTDKGLYISEGHDCDDFAAALWGAFQKSQWWSKLAFGMVFVKWEERNARHAVNFFVDDEMKVYYVEPQTDGNWKVKYKNEWDAYFTML